MVEGGYTGERLSKAPELGSQLECPLKTPRSLARSLARSLDRQCPLLPACHTHTHIHASLQSVCRCCLSDLNLHFQNVFSNDRDSSQQTDEHDEDSIQCPSPFQNLEACNGDACGYDRFSC